MPLGHNLAHGGIEKIGYPKVSVLIRMAVVQIYACIFIEGGAGFNYLEAVFLCHTAHDVVVLTVLIDGESAMNGDEQRRKLRHSLGFFKITSLLIGRGQVLPREIGS